MTCQIFVVDQYQLILVFDLNGKLMKEVNPNLSDTLSHMEFLCMMI